MRFALTVAALSLACARAATPAAPPAPTMEAHRDPSPPLALAVVAEEQGDEATVSVRVTSQRRLPGLTVVLELPQGVERVDGDLRKTFAPVAENATFTLRVRVRSVGAHSPATLRAWTEAREVTALYGDEGAVTLFGVAAAQPTTVERDVVTPDGQRLHDTLIP